MMKPGSSMNKRRSATFFMETVVVGVMFLLHYQRVEGLGSRTTLFYDDACTAGEEMIVTTVYDGYLFTTDEVDPFNECIVQDIDQSSYFGACDAITGEVGMTTYSDSECTSSSEENYTTVVCSDLTDTEACALGGSCSMSYLCVDAEPSTYDFSQPMTFRAFQYTDADCTDPTGVEEILGAEILETSSATSSNTGSCGSSSEGGRYGASTCLSDNSYVTQEFSSDDSTCSGEVHFESEVTFYSICMLFAIEGFYYRIYECTTEAATIVTGASNTVAPATVVPATTPSPVATPAPSATTSSTADGTPAPVETIATPVPTLETASASTSSSSSVTPAPQAGDRGITVTPAPVAAGDDDTDGSAATTSDASAPSSSSSSEQGVVPGSATPAPTSDSEAGAAGDSTSGAAGRFGTSSGKRGASVVWTCAFGLALLFRMDGR